MSTHLNSRLGCSPRPSHCSDNAQSRFTHANVRRCTSTIDQNGAIKQTKPGPTGLKSSNSIKQPEPKRKSDEKQSPLIMESQSGNVSAFGQPGRWLRCASGLKGGLSAAEAPMRTEKIKELQRQLQAFMDESDDSDRGSVRSVSTCATSTQLPPQSPAKRKPRPPSAAQLADSFGNLDALLDCLADSSHQAHKDMEQCLQETIADLAKCPALNTTRTRVFPFAR